MKPEVNHRIVSFFKESYQSDNRGINLFNLFSRKVSIKSSLEELRKNALIETGRLELNSEEVDLFVDILAKYKREKTLLFATKHIVLNVLNENGRTTKICAPIIFYTAKIKEIKGGYGLVIDSTDFNWNFSVLKEILGDKLKLSALDALIIPENPLKLDESKLFDWFNKVCSSHSFHLEKCSDLEELKKINAKRSKTKGHIVDLGALLVVDRSVNTRGVIHELEQLGQEKVLPKSLIQLLSGKRFKISKTIEPDFSNLPGVLSEAQQKILVNAATKRLSQVIGPPGTGKSYTIAHIAVDRFLKGEKVLIVSQNEHAIDVINRQLATKLGVSSRGVVRAGASAYHKRLKRIFSDLLNSFHVSNYYENNASQFLEKQRLNNSLKELRNEIKALEHSFIIRSKKNVKYGVDLDAHLNDNSFWSFINGYRVKSSIKRINQKQMLHEEIDELHKLYEQREKIVADLINHTYDVKINDTLTNYYGRKNIVKFHSALKARTSSRQASIFEQTNFRSILNVLPIWLCSLEGLHKSIPLETNLFDLVIIDEATQCDIASCLPAIYRAKRVVVVGDPKQLRHVSFLSRKKQDMIREKFGLDEVDVPLNYRDESMIDMINHNLESSEDVVLLDEHYRSLPEIIRFSNNRFYNNRLRIMTERPFDRKGNVISVIKSNGERINGVNLEEADDLMIYLKEIIERQKELPEAYKLSIGILSFFRDQAELLQSKLLELPAKYLHEHQLRAGTPYAFQGEERDIMLISCAVDNQSKGGTYVYLNNENMFNVAMTRAKSSQVLFLSAEKEYIPKTSLLNQYLDSIQIIDDVNHETLKSENEYIKDLAEELNKRKIQLIQNYSIAGVLMDLVAIYKGNCIAIDLIGFPGQYEDAFHLNRYKIFDRAGFSIFPITLIEWRYKRKEIVDRLSLELNNRIETEKISVKPQSLSDKWPLLLRFNPAVAKDVRLLEMDIAEIRNGKVLQQLGELTESYHKFVKILSEQLSDGEHTFARYKTAADSVLDFTVNNYKKIIALDQSTPVLESTDKNNPIFNLAKEQRHLIDSILELNASVIHQMQSMTIGWSRVSTKSKNQNVEAVLNQLRSLTDQIKKYNN